MPPATNKKASDFSEAFLFKLSDSLCGHRLQICAIVVHISERSGWVDLLTTVDHFIRACKLVY